MIKDILPKGYFNFMMGLFYVFLTLGQGIPFSFGSPSIVQYWRIIFSCFIIIKIPKLIILLLFYRLENPNFIYKKSNN